MAIFYFYPDEPCAIEIGLNIVPILVPSSFFARHLSRLSIINNIIITAKTIMPEIVNIAISSLIILVPVLSIMPELLSGRIGEEDRRSSSLQMPAHQGLMWSPTAVKSMANSMIAMYMTIQIASIVSSPLIPMSFLSASNQ